MRFYTTGPTEYTDASIENFEGAIDLDGKVDVTWSINNIEAMVVPEAGRGSRLNRDSALLLLFHEVGGGGTIVYFAKLVDFTG